MAMLIRFKIPFMAMILLVMRPLSVIAADEAPGDCFGIDFNVAHPMSVAKIGTDQPQVHFLKNVYDNPNCPANTAACAQAAYLVPGNLVLVGKTHDAFTCVAYQSITDPKPNWHNGWLPTASITPVLPNPAPSRTDWIGSWKHGGGDITIKPIKNGAVAVSGEAFYDAAQNVHTGVMEATAKPAHGLLQFADDGTSPFNKSSDDQGLCLVRMQRIENLLVVEDNDACGGSMVTFTGIYWKK